MDKAVVDNYFPCDENRYLWQSVESDDLRMFIIEAKYYSVLFDSETDQMIHLFDVYAYCIIFNKPEIARFLEPFVNDSRAIKLRAIRNYPSKKFTCPLYLQKLQKQNHIELCHYIRSQLPTDFKTNRK